MREEGGGAARLILNLYLSLFILWLLLPVVALVAPLLLPSTGISADATRGFAPQGFSALIADPDLLGGLLASLGLGAAVVALSLPLGLAGALTIHRLGTRASRGLFAVLVLPILLPGLVLGLSTSLLWREVGVDDGIHLAVLARGGQTAAFAMLLFLARLDRLDPRFEEAAVDLGASPGLVLRRIVWPHLAPAAPIAALVAFVHAFGDHDTVALAAGSAPTLIATLLPRLTIGVDPAAAVAAAIPAVLALAAAGTWLLVGRDRA